MQSLAACVLNSHSDLESTLNTERVDGSRSPTWKGLPWLLNIKSWLLSLLFSNLKTNAIHVDKKPGTSALGAAGSLPYRGTTPYGSIS